MIYIYQIQQLIEQWGKRSRSNIQPQAYKDALYECAFDLNQLIEKSKEEDMDFEDAIKEMETNYSIRPEAHGVYV